ncbi:5-carboxymethyl-2-hydroxymuconate isomerase [Phaeobacter sp.]|uniref:5-carboxymethyl-2-hydroxymuconate isomerase n=1 Tax=Phaeobacter sp. TaxID=1902409 RepID=UPI0025DEAF45|nr:5-carboxymethyl-2-hydroxymuconate isomerase [Phaeobacter sp.]
MPHITVDYSRNMQERVDITLLCDSLRRAAEATGVFPLAGIRVRAFAADHVSLADGNPAHGYLDISVRLRAGRNNDTKQQVTQAIFAAAEAQLADAMEHHSIALSLELRDIDPDLSPKSGTIRKHLAKEASQ